MVLFSFSAFSMIRSLGRLPGRASILKPSLIASPSMRLFSESLRNVSSKATSLPDYGLKKLEKSSNDGDELGGRELSQGQIKDVVLDNHQLDFCSIESEPIANLKTLGGTISSYTGFPLDGMDKIKRNRFLNGMKALFPNINFFKGEGDKQHFGAFVLDNDELENMPLCSRVIKSIIDGSYRYDLSFVIVDTPDCDCVNGENTDTHVHFNGNYFLIKLNSVTDRFIYMKNLDDKKEVIRRKESFAYLHSILHELAHIYRIINKLELKDDNEEEDATIDFTNKMWTELMLRELGKPYTETTMIHYRFGVSDD